ncbi:Glutamate--tRNA ligase mitochondrial [Pseudogymnoascus destructans]|uniref:Glutamate--tRNA ligase, mitochondrial n=2 Tax=Pseudogymnoascus destructans TaxID=655981 RepID=L8FMX9_PSED2|nr:Glutamate--tRNA ligase mitochondrial [Pseudogymnoascus destructans]ELR02315.1 glutamyl-tRNA synthetase [Pseudogymnoascus destructans 20631-21]OAF62132.1 Glutamate--tRNA ligase mitochondrial [Pseudogymnoascus destructans]
MSLLLIGSSRRTLTPLWTCSFCRRISKLATAGTARPTYKLPETPARTRFAPSPTGYLHLGSLRTALFSYLLAKSTDGQFLLRIEDTDQPRTVADAETRIKEDLKWAGLHWDEGPDVGGPYGPYKQSERLNIYRDHASKLLDTGRAYRCFCPREKRNLGDAGLHASAGFKSHDCNRVSKDTSDGRAAQGDPFVVRLKLPEYTKRYRDLVFGNVASSKTSPMDADPVLMKSDNWPTYHLACVVDDHLMGITHVIRGSEWIPSVPTHHHLYDAFGWQPPTFGHVGLLTDLNGQKLSKRNFDLDISAFRNMGVLPDALSNFVALLGWSHTQKKDTMDIQELAKNFSTKFTKGDTKVSFDKLWFLQRQHAQRIITSAKTPDDVQSIIQPILAALKQKCSSCSIPESSTPADQQDRLLQILKSDAPNYKNASDFVERHKYTFDGPSAEALISIKSPITVIGHLCHLSNLPEEIKPEVVNSSIVKVVQQVSTMLTQEDPLLSTDEKGKRLRAHFSDVVQNTVSQNLREINVSDNEELFVALKKSWAALLHQYIRWALVADTPGPDSASLMTALGPMETLRRFDLAEKVALGQPGSNVVANVEK